MASTQTVTIETKKEVYERVTKVLRETGKMGVEKLRDEYGVPYKTLAEWCREARNHINAEQMHKETDMEMHKAAEALMQLYREDTAVSVLMELKTERVFKKQDKKKVENTAERRVEKRAREGNEDKKVIKKPMIKKSDPIKKAPSKK